MEIFTPQADDKFAAPLVEVAQVKSSGYLTPYGIGPDALAVCIADAQARGGRVVVTRPLGTSEWHIVAQEVGEVNIPDSLPEDFA
jgi:hypothetical protein